MDFPEHAWAIGSKGVEYPVFLVSILSEKIVLA
jgi:hypothetical protein